MFENLEEVASVGVFGRFGRGAVGNNAHDLFAQSFFFGKNWQRVAVTFAHLAPVDAGDGLNVFSDDAFGDFQRFAVNPVEVVGDIAGDFDMLFLIHADWHNVRVI